MSGPAEEKTWACLWLSRLEKLRQFVNSKAKDPNIPCSYSRKDPSDQTMFVVLSCCSQGPSLLFNMYSREIREPRDRKLPPEVRYHTKRSTALLGTFEYLLGCPGLEGGIVHYRENRDLRKSPITVHLCWNSCEFALKPIRPEPDKKSMEAKFYWLKHRPRSENTSLVETPDLPSDFPPGRGDMKFWDCLMEQKICSGHTIVMRTDDPINRPLPSEELLGMQWHLNRLAAISGVSEIPDPQQPPSKKIS
ncbi:hypothetical protein V8E54_011216 [Elaphomyces granulatus]